MEKGITVKPCYMRAVLVSAKATSKFQHWDEEFILYTAMSHKQSPLTTVDTDDKVSCTRHFSPFWAVMLAGRDTAKMVNMVPYMEEYTIPQAVAKTHGIVMLGSKITVQLPFLSNKRDLVAGELLALPFDGGHSAICCEEFPSIVKTKS